MDSKFILPTLSHSEDEVSFLKLGNRPVEEVWCDTIALITLLHVVVRLGYLTQPVPDKATQNFSEAA